jgi:hypothetical protein
VSHSLLLATDNKKGRQRTSRLVLMRRQRRLVVWLAIDMALALGVHSGQVRSGMRSICGASSRVVGVTKPFGLRKKMFYCTQLRSDRYIFKFSAYHRRPCPSLTL